MPTTGITTVSDLSSAGTTAYELFAYFRLRPRLYFDACADIRPTNQSHRGSTVTFTMWEDLAPAVTPIPEADDIDAVELDDDVVTISLAEYGNAVMTSAAVRAYSYLVVSEDKANLVGWNAGVSFDSLARNPMLAGDNVRFGGAAAGPRASLTGTDLLTAHDVRFVGAMMAENSVEPYGSYYKAFISPLVSADLREEVGAAAWRDPHTYSQPAEIWNGEIGVFEGFSFIETPRLSARALETAQGGPGGFVDAGVSDADVHVTLFAGRQALAKTWSTMVSAPTPQIVLGNVLDKLGRFVPLGWYWNGGYGRFREESLWRVESASTTVIA